MENSLDKCHFFVKKDEYGNVVCIYQLDENSKMFLYPFSNVSNDFSLCTGDNELPAIKSPYSLSNMPDYILSLPDNDDHFNRRNNKLNLSHRELMEHLAKRARECGMKTVLVV